MKKLIFLDFDGVLNHESYWQEGRHEGKEFPHSHLDERCVKRLNNIIDKTGAEVVISTTWRESWDIGALTDVLKQLGFTGKVFGATPVIKEPWAIRGNEIMAFIQGVENLVGPWWEYKDYLILDDDTDMLSWQKRNFINVDRRVGIDDLVVVESMYVLNDMVGDHEHMNMNLVRGSRIYNKLSELKSKK